MYRTPSGMTLDDVIVKTGLLLGRWSSVSALRRGSSTSGMGVVVLAALVGFVLAMVNIFKKQVSVAAGAGVRRRAGRLRRRDQRHATRATYRGIVVQAVVGTTAVFGAVLLGYRSGRLRATPKFAKVVTFGLSGWSAVVLLNMIASAFGAGDTLGIRGGPRPRRSSSRVGLIVFGALTFVMDFDEADRMVAAGRAGEGVVARRLRPRRRPDLPLPQHPAAAVATSRAD